MSGGRWRRRWRGARAVVAWVSRRALAGAAGLAALAAPAAWAGDEAGEAGRAIRAAEERVGGRLGVAALDTRTGRRFERRGGERFPVASTFKVLLAAAVLAEVDRGRDRLDRRVPIEPGDLVDYAPVTGKNLGPEGMSVAALMEATVVWSDNPAANLLLPVVGGPAGLTQVLRGWGDEAFRLDRVETALGEGTPGDPRDTTTPLAMLGSLHRVLLGNVLSPASRERLTGWMLGCRTGDAKIRAGLPAGWRCANKTGGGGHGTNNDVALLWPPATEAGRGPVLLAIYLTESGASQGERDGALASVGRAVVASL